MAVDRKLVGRLISEATGMFILMYVGCLSCCSTFDFPRDLLDSGTGFGLAVMMALQCFAFLSGAHVNPAVSVANCILGLMDWKMLIGYLLMQIAGGVVGFTLIKVHTVGEGVCLTLPLPPIKAYQALILEFIMTSVLIFFCCGVWDPRNKNKNDSVALRFGLLISGLIYGGGHYTGSSLNLTRTLIPHLYEWNLKTLWIYVVSHLLAMILVPLLWRFVLAEETAKKSSSTTEPA